MIHREVHEIFKRANYFQTPESFLPFEIESNKPAYVLKISSLNFPFYLIQIGEVSRSIAEFCQYGFF